jgi:hypothetical protein
MTTTNFIDKFFNNNAHHLNDIYGIDYTQNYATYSGWTDFTDTFLDSIALFCAFDMNQHTVQNYIIYIVGVVRQKIALNFAKYDVKPKVKYVRHYDTWKKYDYYSSWVLEGKEEWDAGCIVLNVTFRGMEEVIMDYYNILNRTLTELRDECRVVLRSVDITVDCGRISNRKLIENFILTNNLAKKEDIINDRSSVGDNCISFKRNSSEIKDRRCQSLPTRVKIYNKFIQMLESAELLTSIGSRLSHLVADPSPSFVNKVKRFREIGFTRIELTIYGSELYSLYMYKIELDWLAKVELKGCPTFQVPLKDQWHLIADRLKQVMAVYIEDHQTIAYCHWWNSLTKRKQGIIKSNFQLELIPSFLSNFSFNQMPIHCFYVRSNKVVKHEIYKRPDDSIAMTLVPGLANSLFPSRKNLHINVKFEDIGIDSYKGIFIEWPEERLRRYRHEAIASVSLVQSNDAFDMSQLVDTLPTFLTVNETVQASKHEPDYKILAENCSYTIIAYGYGLFRSKEYLCLTLESNQKTRCGNVMRATIEPRLQNGTCFQFHVQRIAKTGGYMNVFCNIV